MVRRPSNGTVQLWPKLSSVLPSRYSHQNDPEILLKELIRHVLMPNVVVALYPQVEVQVGSRWTAGSRA